MTRCAGERQRSSACERGETDDEKSKNRGGPTDIRPHPRTKDHEISRIVVELRSVIMIDRPHSVVSVDEKVCFDVASLFEIRRAIGDVGGVLLRN